MIRARVVIEIMGRPPEHIKNALVQVGERMGTEKGVKIINKKEHEPIPVEKADNLFSSFSEIEAEFDSLEAFFSILFGYMPANVEIFSPENLNLPISHVNALSNVIIDKLHKYDAVVKRVLSERDVLIKQIEYFKNRGGVNYNLGVAPTKENKEIKKLPIEKKEISKTRASKKRKKK